MDEVGEATPADVAALGEDAAEVLVVVTGGSAGLGRALLATAPRDAHRVDISRSGASGRADTHVAADLADPDSWPRVGRALHQLVGARTWRRVIVVHNAGVLRPLGFAAEVDAVSYTANVLLNSAAPQVIGQAALAAMAGLDARCELVMISSGAATSVSRGWSSYAAGKAALEHWVRGVGAEQQQRGGVRVLAVAPGVVDTGMQELVRTADADDFPRVEHFRRLHEQGALVAQDEAARRVWEVVDDTSWSSGTVTDVRRR